jgi:hypothetical protein
VVGLQIVCMNMPKEETTLKSVWGMEKLATDKV